MPDLSTLELPEREQQPKLLNIALWVAQWELAALFLLSGALKTTLPIAKLSALLPWTGDAPLAFVRFVGVSELLGAVGLLLPALLRIKPQLTPWAAIGLAVILLLSIPFHIQRGEALAVVPNMLHLAAAIFVAWGRFGRASVQPKSGFNGARA